MIEFCVVRELYKNLITCGLWGTLLSRGWGGLFLFMAKIFKNLPKKRVKLKFDEMKRYVNF